MAYSQKIHAQWVDAFYNGYRPSDPNDGRANFSIFGTLSGMQATPYRPGSPRARCRTRPSYANKIERLQEVAARFDEVVLENPGWSEAFEKYDSEETVFYCDLPYVGKEGYYPVSEIEHSEFVWALGELDGSWIVSYTELPGGLDDHRVVGRGERNYMGNGKSGSTKQTREHLMMNF